jgi:MerR family transcriptional regulator, light-induced transcriptional regulator
MKPVTDMAGLTIGQLAQRVGISADVLRAWERRYALLTPHRTEAGYRLYSPDDVRLVQRVVALRDQGLGTGQAVVAARATRASDPDPTAPDRVQALARAVRVFDEEGLESAVEAAFASLGIAGTLRDVVLPYLAQLGDQWAAGDVSVAHEHFASQCIRRLVAQRESAPPPSGRPVALLATPPGERHDLGLLCFALLLGQVGWATRFIGADTPMASLQLSCQAVRPDAVVLSATREGVFLSRSAGLRRLAHEWPLALGGRGATDVVADELGAFALPADIVAAVPALEQLVSVSVA